MSDAELEADDGVGWVNVQICFANVYANIRESTSRVAVGVGSSYTHIYIYI